MNIGNNISALRKSAGITQDDLAKAIGVSAQAVSKWENNSSCPDVSLLTVIADFFNVTVDALLRANEDDILRDNTADDKNSRKNFKKTLSITIVQKNGKENNVRIPFRFVKAGLDIATAFGFEKSIADKITELVNDENIEDIADITTESGEHITIVLV